MCINEDKLADLRYTSFYVHLYPLSPNLYVRRLTGRQPVTIYCNKQASNLCPPNLNAGV